METYGVIIYKGKRENGLTVPQVNRETHNEAMRILSLVHAPVQDIIDGMKENKSDHKSEGCECIGCCSDCCECTDKNNCGWCQTNCV